MCNLDYTFAICQEFHQMQFGTVYQDPHESHQLRKLMSFKWLQSPSPSFSSSCMHAWYYWAMYIFKIAPKTDQNLKIFSRWGGERGGEARNPIWNSAIYKLLTDISITDLSCLSFCAVFSSSSLGDSPLPSRSSSNSRDISSTLYFVWVHLSYSTRAQVGTWVVPLFCILMRVNDPLPHMALLWCGTYTILY